MVLCWNFLNSKSYVNTLGCDFKKWFSFFCHNNNNVDDDKLDKALYKKIKTLISKKASLIESIVRRKTLVRKLIVLSFVCFC